jgi:peptidoglycan lytic transglycosylase
MVLRSSALCCAAFLVVGSSAAFAETGIASVYFYSGSKSASGERTNPNGLTAAHRTLPFGTQVRVTNKRNGQSVVVRINDRGPFIRGRVIDLTPAGARALGFSGLAPVTVERTSETNTARSGESIPDSGADAGSFASVKSASNERTAVLTKD